MFRPDTTQGTKWAKKNAEKGAERKFSEIPSFFPGSRSSGLSSLTGNQTVGGRGVEKKGGTGSETIAKKRGPQLQKQYEGGGDAQKNQGSFFSRALSSFWKVTACVTRSKGLPGRAPP